MITLMEKEKRIEGVKDFWLKFEDVLEITNQGRSFMQTEISSGRLPSIKVGRSRRIKSSDLNAWMAGFDGTGQVA